MHNDIADTQPASAQDDGDAPAPTVRRRWRAWLAGVALVLGVAATVAWFARERIAQDLISSQLEKSGVPSRYTIESIGPRRQVLTNVVLGDPQRPDFTADRVEISLAARLGLPGVHSVRLVRPRLFGTYLQGKLSFGKLDPLIFGKGEKPFELPDMRLEIEDGGGVIESDFGRAAVRLHGSGNLRGGFAGELAGIVPSLVAGDCRADRATVYGRIAVKARKPEFSGPVRLGALACGGSDGLRLAGVEAQARVSFVEALDRGEARLSLRTGALGLGASRLAASGGTARVAWGKDGLTGNYDLAGRGITTSQARMTRLAVSGRLRALDGFSRLEVEGEVDGRQVRPGDALEASMAATAAKGGGSLPGALATAVRSALAKEARASRLSGGFIVRRAPGLTALVVPSLTLRGSSGTALLSLSRVQARLAQGAPMELTGNFATGGAGLPRINGRMESSPVGQVFRIRMAEYVAGGQRIELPHLYLAQGPGGAIGIAGQARLSGALPGGRAENLLLPLQGKWSPDRGLAFWPRCVNLRFDRLELAGFAFERRGIPVCPPRGGAIVRFGPAGIRVAGGMPALDLAGHVGSTPARLGSGAIGFAWPGNLAARDVRVGLGPREARSEFLITRLDARLADRVSGTFAGADVRLNAVPLDLRDMAGNWALEGGALALRDGSFRLEDREQVDRFQPLVARVASLRLADSVIVADAELREPASDRTVVRAVIDHDLSAGRGHADLTLDGIVFDDRLQPDTLTRLALGVIANAQGSVRGQGRIDWSQAGVTSSGRFATDDLAFAAAFGPVKGLSGTVAFTDLLGLVTAPDQQLHIASINPGIEVNDGRLAFAMLPGHVLSIGGADWPFMGGTLRLEPVSIPIGTDQPLRYVLTMKGLDAALFLQHLELGNLAATGTFDGSLPLVFDKNGGRVEQGRLVSRPPGGNVSYVGQLSYKDLSAMANFAFDALKSIDYRQMQIDLDGSLEGELVTRVTFDGIAQGKGARRNFITRRIARLPIRFRLNVRAPFMQLVTSMRSLNDPAYIRDPRTLGIVDPTGRPIQPIRPPEPSIQPPESGAVR